MKWIVWVVAIVAGMALGLGVAGAFDTPTMTDRNPPIVDKEVIFGLVNADGTTDYKDLFSEYCSFHFAASRIGVGDITLHLKVAKSASSTGVPFGFVNVTGSSGHTVDTDTDNLGFGIPVSSGHCGRYIKLTVSGANFANALTNTVIWGKVD